MESCSQRPRGKIPRQRLRSCIRVRLLGYRADRFLSAASPVIIVWKHASNAAYEGSLSGLGAIRVEHASTGGQRARADCRKPSIIESNLPNTTGPPPITSQHERISRGWSRGAPSPLIRVSGHGLCLSHCCSESARAMPNDYSVCKVITADGVGRGLPR